MFSHISLTVHIGNLLLPRQHPCNSKYHRTNTVSDFAFKKQLTCLAHHKNSWMFHAGPTDRSLQLLISCSWLVCCLPILNVFLQFFTSLCSHYDCWMGDTLSPLTFKLLLGSGLWAMGKFFLLPSPSLPLPLQTLSIVGNIWNIVDIYGSCDGQWRTTLGQCVVGDVWHLHESCSPRTFLNVPH